MHWNEYKSKRSVLFWYPVTHIEVTVNGKWKGDLARKEEKAMGGREKEGTGERGEICVKLFKFVYLRIWGIVTKINST